MTGASAVQNALNAYRLPSRLRFWQNQDLPSDFLVLIKICAGDSETIAFWSQQYNLDQCELRAAATLILNHVISEAGNDNFRRLGLSQHASVEDIRLHKRWLLKWLHPDRNHNAWESALFRKISEAANWIEQNQDLGPPQNDDVGAVQRPLSISNGQTRNRNLVRHRPVGRPVASRASDAGMANKSPGFVRTALWGSLFRRVMRRALMALGIVAVVAAILAAINYLGLAEGFDFGSFNELLW